MSSQIPQRGAPYPDVILCLGQVLPRESFKKCLQSIVFDMSQYEVRITSITAVSLLLDKNKFTLYLNDRLPIAEHFNHPVRQHGKHAAIRSSTA